MSPHFKNEINDLRRTPRVLFVCLRSNAPKQFVTRTTPYLPNYKGDIHLGLGSEGSFPSRSVCYIESRFESRNKYYLQVVRVCVCLDGRFSSLGRDSFASLLRCKVSVDRALSFQISLDRSCGDHFEDRHETVVIGRAITGASRYHRLVVDLHVGDVIFGYPETREYSSPIVREDQQPFSPRDSFVKSEDFSCLE